MQVSEALIMDLCNVQQDIGTYRERIDWLHQHLATCPDDDVELVKRRLEMAEMGLANAGERLRKIYKELYGD